MHTHATIGSPARRASPALLAILVAGVLFGAPPLAGALDAQTRAHAVADPEEHPNRATIPFESSVTTEHSVTVNGEDIPYRATAGTLPVYDAEGEAVAAVFYVYYQRSDVEDPSERPLMFSFNGGPGSSSIWMHLGYTGPMRLNIDDEGNPVRPYGVRENPYSVIDATDIVFVDPVNVGLSRMAEGADREQFFGVNQDVNYLASWIELFVNRHNRWTSPVFLIGESYGTTRVAGLSQRLQSAHKLFVNGVILVSPTSLGHSHRLPSSVRNLPHYAATAWYFGKLPPELRNRDLEDVLEEVEEFAIHEYAPILAYGGALDEAEREAIAQRIAEYAGVRPEVVENRNLELPISHWRKELLRDERLTVGRLDSRYQGVDGDAAGTSYDYDPAMASWNHSFTPAMKTYLKEDLQYDTELEYVTIGGSVRPWDRSGNNTGEQLRRAMAANPFLHTLTQAGYYDGATDYFSAKLLHWGLDRSGQLQDRFHYEVYRSGHMMYLREEDLETSNRHVREFIEMAVPEDGVPALWGRRVPVAEEEEEDGGR